MIIKFPEKVTEASLTQHENYTAIKTNHYFYGFLFFKINRHLLMMVLAMMATINILVFFIPVPFSPFNHYL